MTAKHAGDRAFIALGSNIDPARHLPLAVAALGQLGSVKAVSQVWESEPVGGMRQANFCNAAVLLETALAPRDLKLRLQRLEEKLGRVRDPADKNAPRSIDLDIALYDDLIVHEPDLQIPDPDIPARPFLAVPLAELDAAAIHPVLRKTLREIAEGTGGARALTLRTDIVLAVPARR
jgi:2-amino-4-hydroxy-6-hydroxymethyldihydropteridine diphosphokinase